MKLKLAAVMIFTCAVARAQEPAPEELGSCGEMTTWNYSTGMCDGRAMPGMPMSMLMIHGNTFLVGDVEEGPRGRNKISMPNMIMASLGASVADRSYVNFDLMATFERWTFPDTGDPLLLQIGEENQNEVPYIDAQHPHSSPIMGLTLSETYSIGDHDHVKAFAAPRGEATDGPTAFMHRPSGQVNPDAPLGHHIGQDVGHIASSVIGGELRLRQTNFEISTFYGSEPQPSKVDLPVAVPNSYAVRLTQQWTRALHFMMSAAYVKAPEAHDPDLDHIWRYSASIYNDVKVESGWMFHDAFIYGLVNFYDHAGALSSFLYEATLARGDSNYWGRIEAVQRTPDELNITTSNDRTTGQYVELFTLGYTRTVRHFESTELRVGGSVSKDFLPASYRTDYAGNPVTAKMFVQLAGLRMWDL